MIKTILLTLIMLSGLSCFAQISKKQAIEHNIKSVAEWETNLKSRKSKPIQESFTKYDKKGHLLEIIERDNNGIITLHETYEYNDVGKKITEIQYEPTGSVKKRHVYKYVNGLRTERLTYDKRNNLIAKKKYIYEFQDK